MSSEDDEPKVRKHLWLNQADWERLEALYGKTVGTSKALRLILRKFLDGAEARALSDTTKLKGLQDHDTAAVAPTDAPVGLPDSPGVPAC